MHTPASKDSCLTHTLSCDIMDNRAPPPFPPLPSTLQPVRDVPSPPSPITASLTQPLLEPLSKTTLSPETVTSIVHRQSSPSVLLQFTFTNDTKFVLVEFVAKHKVHLAGHGQLNSTYEKVHMTFMQNLPPSRFKTDAVSVVNNLQEKS